MHINADAKQKPSLTIHNAVTICCHIACGCLQGLQASMMPWSLSQSMLVCCANHVNELDITCAQGLTPLVVAASNGDAKVARLLLKHNADFQTTGPKV